MADTTTFPFTKNQNNCSSCGKKNLPEPIAFAQLSRLTSEYVCSTCYTNHSGIAVIRMAGKLQDMALNGDFS